MEHSPSVFEFKLNSPKTLNSIDIEMIKLMLRKVKEWKQFPSEAPRVAILSGTGGKAFCAGGDIVSIYNSAVGKLDRKIMNDHSLYEFLIQYSLSQMSPKQISIWNGVVMGAGVGISMHSSIKVATESTVFAMPETGIGYFTDAGSSYFLSRIKNNISLGLYLGLTGQRIRAKDLVKWGIATHFVPSHMISSLCQDIVKNVNENTPESLI